MKSGWLFLILSVLSYGFWGFAAKISVQRGASSTMLTILTAVGSGLLALVACVPLLDFAHLNLNSEENTDPFFPKERVCWARTSCWPRRPFKA